jgi:hypothetical protein
VTFSDNCEDAVKEEVMQALQIPTEALGERYLGLPTAIGKVTDGVFNYVPERIRSFVNGWGEDFLSCAGREVLIKANTLAIPTYPMSCFRLPTGVCKKMRTYITNFWWGSSINNHKLHWQKWSKLTRSKHNGGMGFRDMPLFNQAMLAKQGWRLLVNPDSLVAKVLKGKYYPQGDFLSATKRKRSSETWRAILCGREALKKGLIKRIGPGDLVNIWSNWIAGLRSMKLMVRVDGVNWETVNDLFVPGTRVWNEQLVRPSFLPLDVEEILKVRPGLCMQEDMMAWADERNGWFSVRSCYWRLKAEWR